MIYSRRTAKAFREALLKTIARKQESSNPRQENTTEFTYCHLSFN